MPNRYLEDTGINQLFQILHALFPEKDSLDEYRMWYRNSVEQKIKERSWKYEGVPGTYIDIVNVLNATSVHWAADRLVRFPLPLCNFHFQNLTVKFFLVRSSNEDKREPLWIVHRTRDLRYVRSFGEYWV